MILTTPVSFVGEDMRLIISTLYRNQLLEKITVVDAYFILEHGLGFRSNYLKLITYFVSVRNAQFVFCSGSFLNEAIEKIVKLSRLPTYTVIRACYLN